MAIKIPRARNTNPRVWRSVHYSQSDAIAKMQGKETIKSSFKKNGTLCLCSLTSSRCCEQHVQNNSSCSLSTAGKALIKPDAWQSWSHGGLPQHPAKPSPCLLCLLASLPPGCGRPPDKQGTEMNLLLGKAREPQEARGALH